MSSPSNLFNGTYAQEVETYELTSTVTIAVTALLAYTHLLALQREIKCIWTQRMQPISWLYIFIRYPALLNLLILVSLNSTTPHCTALVRFSDYLLVASMAGSYGLQILTTHAVSKRKWMVTGALLVICLPACACFLWTATEDGCSTGEAFSADNALRVAMEWTSDISFETSVLLVTVWHTWSLAFGNASKSNNSLPQTILRNRILCYGLLLFLDVGNLVLGKFQRSVGAISAYWMFHTFNYPLRWILLSEFILELREKALDAAPKTPTFPTTIVMVSMTEPTWE